MKSPVTPEESHADREERTVYPCTARKRDGKLCGRYVATIPTPDGWRCPSHKPRVAAPPSPSAPQPPKLPVTKLKTPADAIALSSWASLAVARGEISPQQANAVANNCRVFCRSFEVGIVAEGGGDPRKLDAAVAAALTAWEFIEALEKEHLLFASSEDLRAFATSSHNYQPDPKALESRDKLDGPPVRMDTWNSRPPANDAYNRAAVAHNHLFALLRGEDEEPPELPETRKVIDADPDDDDAE